MSLAPATRIGPYQVVSLLGAGGMGEVYRARDTRLDRTVALKVMPADKLANEQRRARFLQEARAASALNHPNIVALYDIVSESGAECLVMEYVAGKALNDAIPKKGLRLSETLRYAIQIADGVAAAHRAGIVHRDLKPGNIMVTETGAVKILDFGLAKLTEAASADESATQTVVDGGPQTVDGVVMGTVAYMSPEQAEGKPVDARTDIFSFGCVLYEMITGRRPFHGDSQASTISAILRDEPAPAGDLVSDLPRDLEKIIARCLRKDANRRFQNMADVKIALEELKEESESGSAVPARAPVSRRRTPRWVLPGAAAAIAVAALIAWGMLSRRTADVPLQAVPFTSYPGYETQATFSPEGNQVAFAWDGANRESQNDIYVKLIGPGEPLRLTREGGTSPAWSPDGRWIAFVRLAKGSTPALTLIPPLGGSERRITDILANLSPAAWSPDSKWIAYGSGSGANEPGGVFLVSVETGEKRRLTSAALPVIGHTRPAFAPDGRHLAFSAVTGISGSDIYTLALTADLRADGAPRRITTDGRGNITPVWTPDGGEIVYASERGGRLGLWRVPASGSGTPRRFASVGDAGVFPVISRQGRLIYTRRFSDANIWRVSLRGETGGEAAMLFGSTLDDQNAHYSPDGKRIVFQSTRSGAAEIWICDADGSHPAQLKNFGEGHTGSPEWSPDGSRIAFDSNQPGRFQIYTMDAAGGTPRRLMESPDEDAVPRWSRDGRWIYFRSNRSGSYQIWKVPAQGGTAVQVTTTGGHAALESEDGKWLYYTKQETTGELPLFRMPVSGGAETVVVKGVHGRDFDMAGRGVYYIGRDQPRAYVLRYFDTASGKEKALAKVPDLLHFLSLSISPDERWAIFTKVDQAGSDLMLVDNFR